MKIINKVITLLPLVIVALTSCNSFTSPLVMSPTDVMETAIPITTFTAMPSPSPLPSTETSIPIVTSIPVSMTPTTVVMENGLTWTECVVPYRDYVRDEPDFELATSCLNLDWLGYDDYNIEINGHRLRETRISGEVGDNLQLIIGEDVYETRYTLSSASNYKLLKNGIVIATVNVSQNGFFDPNLKLWNIGGKSVWEIYSEPPTIVVDGINLTETHQWEGSFFPYDIKNKLIYVAQKNGKYSIVYDDKVIGPEFDEIYMKYCCATTNVIYGHGQYWFWGRREGTYYVVAIH